MNLRWILILLVATAVACATDAPNEKEPGTDTGSAPRDTGGDAGVLPDIGGGDDVAQSECSFGETRDVSCGLNDRGTAEEACAAGVWGPAGDCTDPDTCTDNTTQTAPCGRNSRGMIDQVCTTGAWADNGACVDLDECTDAATRTVACGLNGRGTQDQDCVAGTWDDSGVCTDPDPCVDGTMRVLSCGLNDRGALAQTCLAGDWENSAACVDPDECVDGGFQSVACGLNDRGQQQQSCGAGTWTNIGTCVGVDVCVDGTTQTVTCGLNNAGTQPQLCTTGAWQNDGACSDPDICTNGTMQQIMCGFDGTQAQTCGGGAWTDVGGCVESLVTFCVTQPATLQATVGEASSAVEGSVFVDQKTVGAGMAAGVIGELLWGPAGTAPSTWTDVAPAAYFGDADGLVPGDLANDVWQATITSAIEADYDYAFRFSADNGATWQLCDINGTVDGGFDAGAVGFLEVLPPELPDDCKVQFPNVADGAQVGQPIDFFGRVIEVGVTGMGSAAAGVVGELLVGAAGTDPRPDATGFQTIAATYSAGALNLAADEDEYAATFTPTAAGTFAFGFRFSVDGGTNWEYCGLRDSAVVAPSFEPVKMGWMRAAGSPEVIDFCHVWQDTLSDDATTGTQPTVTVEVFHAGVTDSGAPSTAIEAEAAFLDLEQNPALASPTWNALPYKGPRVGVPQNYEYEGTPYTAATHPSVGSYNVVVRVREPTATDWTYCDIDDSAPAFRLDAASRLTVVP